MKFFLTDENFKLITRPGFAYATQVAAIEQALQCARPCFSSGHRRVATSPVFVCQVVNVIEGPRDEIETIIDEAIAAAQKGATPHV